MSKKTRWCCSRSPRVQTELMYDKLPEEVMLKDFIFNENEKYDP